MDAGTRSFRKIKALLVLVVTIIVVVIVFNILTLSKFHIVSTDPNLNQISNAAPSLAINFNKPVISSSVKIASYPNVIAGYSVHNKTIDISFTSLTINTKYNIIITKVIATNNEVVVNKDLAFVARYISPSNMPKDEEKQILQNQDNYSSPANNPIVAHLPHDTLSYSLSAQITKGSNGKSQLVLNAELLLSEADMSNENAAIAKDKQAIQSYIQSVGLNPQNYTIVYTISVP